MRCNFRHPPGSGRPRSFITSRQVRTQPGRWGGHEVTIAQRPPLSRQTGRDALLANRRADCGHIASVLSGEDTTCPHGSRGTRRRWKYFSTGVPANTRRTRSPRDFGWATADSMVV